VLSHGAGAIVSLGPTAFQGALTLVSDASEFWEFPIPICVV
jgi:hypothetical protein